MHPKDKQPHGRASRVVYGVSCEPPCPDTYIGETIQPLQTRMGQHRRASSTGLNDSAVYTHLDATGHSFKTENVIIMDRDTRWHQIGIKEAIWVRAEQPSLNRNGGTRHNLPHAWDRVIANLPRRLTSSGSHQARFYYYSNYYSIILIRYSRKFEINSGK